MDIEDLMEGVEDLRDWEFERRLHKLIRGNYKYKNLDKENQEIILDLVKKYKSRIKKGRGISSLQIRNEMLKLKRKMDEKGLTKNDLRDIKEILKKFTTK